MPNRILRDYTDSERVDSLSPEAENLFIRLMMKADDFGCFFGDPRVVKSQCFPLKNWGPETVERLLFELSTSGLIELYVVKAKKYIRILGFGQRLRTMRRKFPEPSEKQEVVKNDSSLLTNDRDLQTIVGPEEETEEKPKHETETETETETEEEGKARARGKKSRPHLFRDSEFFEKEKFIREIESSPPPYCNANAESYYEAALNWSDSNSEKNKKTDWIATVKHWMRKDIEEGKFKEKFSQPKNLKSDAAFKDKSERISDHNADQFRRMVGGS